MASSQPWNPPAGGSTDPAGLLRDLERDLARLIELAEGGAVQPESEIPTFSWTQSEPSPAAAGPTPVVWLDDGPPPDPTSAQRSAPSAPQQEPATQPDAKSAAAEKFLKEIGLLIKAFLAQQQPQEPSSSRAAPTATNVPPHMAPVSKETEDRVEVLRKAMVASEAAQAAQELARLQPRELVQEIDHHWNSALAENNALRSQLGQANQEQDRLRQAKRSVEHMLQDKELVLMQIRKAILDLREELVRHKTNLEQQQQARSFVQPSKEKQALIDRLRRGISELERQLERFQTEKRVLEADLARSRGENRGLESQLQHLQGEKKSLEADLAQTLNALQTHRTLKQTLEQSFQNAETEVHALRQLLQQLEVDGSRPSAAAPPANNSAFAPPRTAPYTPAVETVNSEPGHGQPETTTYPFHQNQAPWQAPQTSGHTWEPAKQSAWEPIEKPAPTTTVYHAQVSPPQNYPGEIGSPEWTQQQKARQLQAAEQQKWNYDPPADYVSASGETEMRRSHPPPPPPSHTVWKGDPSAYNGTGSVDYSSAGASQMVESVDAGSYYGPRSYQSQPYSMNQQPSWMSQPPPTVWEEYSTRRQPQEPPPMSTISTEPPATGMAFLQQQMANVVDDARNNPRPAASFSYAAQPQGKLPLQPAAVTVESPERVVPPNGSRNNPYRYHGRAGNWR